MATWADNLAASDGDLLFAYDLEGVSGDVIDSGPSGNDGTNGGATRGVTGKIGDAFDFASSGDYISNGNPITSDSFTFSNWFYLDSAPSNHNNAWLTFTNSGTGDDWFFGYWRTWTGSWTGSSAVRFGYFSSGWFDFGDALDTIATGEWHHYTYRTDGVSSEIFIDGVETFTTASTLDVSALSDLKIGGNSFGGSDSSCDGKLDMTYLWDTALSDTQISDLYNGGTGLEYLPLQYEVFNGETTKLERVGIPATFNSETTKLKSEIVAVFSSETTKLKRQASPVRFFSETTKLKRAEVPVTFNGETTILKATGAESFNGTTAILRREGTMSYYFDLRKEDDTQEASATGAPPQTVFPDLFTGVSDGLKTLHIRSVQKYKNFEDTIDETMIRFRLVAGIRQPLLPNLPLSVSAEMIKDAGAIVSWNYSPTNQETPPTEFAVYVGAVLETTVPYNGAESYSVTIGPLAEIPTVFGVSSKSGVNETPIVDSEPETPDGTPPGTVPFTFEPS